MGSEAETLQEGLARGTREALEGEAEELGQRHGQPPEVAVLTGTVTHAIRDYMESIDADLGVLGASGRGLARQLWLGSTAERVLRRCRRPLLVTKTPPARSYRRILVPVDFSRASRVAVDWASAVAPEAELVVLHAFEVPFEGSSSMPGSTRTPSTATGRRPGTRPPRSSGSSWRASTTVVARYGAVSTTAIRPG
ncbi:MAG: universal stress protein [Arhodomonas sp.]|nr:universal stress protein [Arhodomonas sp.]